MIGSKTGDKHVAKLLKELGLKYDIDSDGDFRVVFNIDDTRSQMVAIESETRRVDNLVIRSVWSIGYESSELFEAGIANALLTHNSEVIFGGWQTILREDDSCTAIFLCPIAANCDARTLESVMHTVALAADHVEKIFTEQDLF